MNERIRQLAIEAMTATTNKFSADREWSADEWRDFYDKKFAELIVRECISVMDNTAKEAQENFTYMDNDVPTTAHQFEIRKHFGVEK